MNDFFDLDAPLFRFLTRVADMVILSLLWLIGSLPLFTLGISSTALYYAVNKSLIENRGTVSEEFFRAYRRSFRQATLSFLALAVPESILLADCFMTHYLKGQQAATGNPWIIFTVLSTCGLAWMIYNAAYAARFGEKATEKLVKFISKSEYPIPPFSPKSIANFIDFFNDSHKPLAILTAPIFFKSNVPTINSTVSISKFEKKSYSPLKTVFQSTLSKNPLIASFRPFTHLFKVLAKAEKSNVAKKLLIASAIFTPN